MASSLLIKEKKMNAIKKIVPFKSGEIAVSGSWTSPVIDLSKYSNSAFFAIQSLVAGAGTGKIEILASNNGINFVDTGNDVATGLQGVAGTADATTAGKIEDSTKNFTALGVQAGSVIKDLTGGSDTTITAVGTTTCDVADDIFVDTDEYTIFMPNTPVDLDTDMLPYCRYFKIIVTETAGTPTETLYADIYLLVQ
jgi:uncharacterized protein YunC (DUF1805 family)